MPKPNTRYGLISHRNVEALNKQRMRRDISGGAKKSLIAGAATVGAVVGGPVGLAVGTVVGTGLAGAITNVEKQAEELARKRRARIQRR